MRKYSRFVMAWPHWLQMRVDAGELEPREFVAGQSYLRLAKEYEDWFAQQSTVEAAPFRGVIFDVDPEFQGTEEWYRQMATSRP